MRGLGGEVPSAEVPGADASLQGSLREASGGAAVCAAHVPCPGCIKKMPFLNDDIGWSLSYECINFADLYWFLFYTTE